MFPDVGGAGGGAISGLGLATAFEAAFLNDLLHFGPCFLASFSGQVLQQCMYPAAAGRSQFSVAHHKIPLPSALGVALGVGSGGGSPFG